MPYLKAEDKKSHSYHWSPFNNIQDLSFVGGEGAIGDTNYIDFSALQGKQTKSIKFHLITQYANDSESIIVYNVWFADSKSQLEERVTSGIPTKVISSSWPFGLPSVVSLNVNTRYMAINFDSSKSTFSRTYTGISIYAS